MYGSKSFSYILRSTDIYQKGKIYLLSVPWLILPSYVNWVSHCKLGLLQREVLLIYRVTCCCAVQFSFLSKLKALELSSCFFSSISVFCFKVLKSFKYFMHKLITFVYNLWLLSMICMRR